MLIGTLVFVFMRQAQFGRLPSGERLERIKKSPHYRDGAFRNMSFTPDLTEGETFYSVMKYFLFGKKERTSPIEAIPSMKVDLLHLDRKDEMLVWFGHSSYFMQIDGKRILVDPVFSGSASPLNFGTKAFRGSDRYTVDDMPDIDYLFISHDHWDHLDYKTVRKLRPKIKQVICGLGVGEHLEYWGYDAAKIIEKDWNETFSLDQGFVVHTVTGRHFSGRGLKRNRSLWTAFVLQTPSMKLFLGGDSGYGQHFADIGEKFGPFDLVMIENGQYDKKWRYIHMLPEEILRAAKDLQAKRILPVHSSKFTLAKHAWDEPLIKITGNNQKENLSIITPMIGEQVNLKDVSQPFSRWWEGVK